MFSPNAFESLFEELKDKGYEGSEIDLGNALDMADRQTNLESVYRFLNRRHFKPHLENLENVSYARNLMDKLIKKFPDARVHSNMFEPTVHFASKKHPTTGHRFMVTMDFKDRTSNGSNGFMGEKYVRIMYGYDDHRAEKIITLVNKEPY